MRTGSKCSRQKVIEGHFLDHAFSRNNLRHYHHRQQVIVIPSQISSDGMVSGKIEMSTSENRVLANSN